MNRHFSRHADGQQAQEKCLSLIREMQIKTTVRYYLNPIRIAKFNKRSNRCWQGREEKEPSLGMQSGGATVENTMEAPLKFQNKVPYDP